MLDGKSIFFDDIWPMYHDGTIERSLDPKDRSPEIALALDYVLLIIHKEQKWTSPIANRYFIRLPWAHPWKATHAGRPGWDALLRILSESGMIERHHGQTWMLKDKMPRLVAEQAISMWANDK